MKKLTAMLLMICLLLTLVSCGEEDEGDMGQTFAGAAEGENSAVTVKSNNYEAEIVSAELDVNDAVNGYPLSTGDEVTTAQQTSSVLVSTTDDDIAEQKTSFDFQLHIDFIPNLIFSRYNVNLDVDGDYEATLTHGEDVELSLTLSAGTHTISFANEDSPSVKGEVELEINSDIDAEFKISCYSDKVSVETIYVDRLVDLAEGEVKMDVAASSYNYKPYQDVTASLKALGFTNIKYSILYDIVFGITDAGDVDSVSIAGNEDFKRAEVFPADAEIIITYHMPEEDNPLLIKMQKYSFAYDGMNYLQVEKSFRDMGFMNIQLGETITERTNYTDGEVWQVKIKGRSFDAGDTFMPEDQVYIEYYHVEAPIAIENITIENSGEFAALMQITNQNDAATIRRFANSHIGDTIEFDGCIALMMCHENYKTRFDVAMVGGSYHAARVYGPMFAFEDVNFSSMNVSGTDTVAEGMNFRITAEIKGYSAAGGYILLDPVSMEVRDANRLEDETQLTVKVVADSVYLRNRTGGAVVLMSKGSSVIIYGYDTSIDMFKARYGDKEGYVKGAGFSMSRNELMGYFR